MRIGFLIAGIALAVAAIVGLNYLFETPEPEPATEPEPVPATPAEEPVPGPVPVPEAPPPPVEPARPALVLPVLDESDGFVRERLEGGALPADWLDREDLLRRLVVVVENGVRGEVPRRQLSFMAPEGKFAVRELGERLLVDPASYARYDGYLDVLESVPPETAAALLRDATPLLDEALRELGATDSFQAQLLVAIERVLAVPAIDGEIELVQPRVYYEYADPALEALPELEKQVLRTGPANTRRLQAYLRALADALGS